MKLGLRELRRKPGRFVVPGLALVFLTVLLLFLGGLLDGLYLGSSGALRSQQADLIVYSSDARDSLVRSRIDGSTRAAIAAVPGVAKTGGLGLVLVGGQPSGSDKAVDLAVLGFETPIKGMSPNQTLPTGEGLADRSLESKGVKVGDTISVGPGKVPVKVGGWVEDSNFLLQGGLWVAPETWRQVLATSRPDAVLAPDAFQAVVVTLAPGASAKAVAADIDKATAGRTRTLTVDEAVLAIPGLKEQNSTFSAIIYVTLAVAGLVVALFFALLTLERTGLYGVFKAIGASSGQLFSGVVVQALVITAVSFAIGAAAVVLLSRVLPAGVPLQLELARSVQVLVGLIVMTALGSAFSLRRVVRIDPASAIG